MFFLVEIKPFRGNPEGFSFAVYRSLKRARKPPGTDFCVPEFTIYRVAINIESALTDITAVVVLFYGMKFKYDINQLDNRKQGNITTGLTRL